jgi:vacuolar-type H+-ATPase subunit H
MSKTDDKVREVCGQQFTTVKNGLDEADVSSFIDSLMAEHAELTQQLQDVDSLMASAENLIVEAGKQAKELATEMEQEARSKADSLVAEAEERARTDAEKIIADLREEARAETERVRKEAEQLRISCKENIGTAIRATFETVCADLFAQRDDAETPMVTATITPVQAETVDSVAPAEEADAADEDTVDSLLDPEALAAPVSDEEVGAVTEVLSEADESTVNESVAQAAEDADDSAEAEDDLYQGQLQIRIAPPVALDGVMRIHRELKTNPQIEVKSFAVSAEDGVTVEVNLPAAMPFEQFLHSLPGVTDVASASQPNTKRGGRRKGAASPVTVFRLTLC